MSFALGLFVGAALTVLVSLAGVGVFALLRIRQAHREAKAREARILAAVAQESASRELQPRTPVVYAQWLPKSRMD